MGGSTSRGGHPHRGTRADRLRPLAEPRQRVRLIPGPVRARSRCSPAGSLRRDRAGGRPTPGAAADLPAAHRHLGQRRHGGGRRDHRRPVLLPLPLPAAGPPLHAAQGRTQPTAPRPDDHRSRLARAALAARTGVKTVLVTGPLLLTAGLGWFSTASVHGTYAATSSGPRSWSERDWACPSSASTSPPPPRSHRVTPAWPGADQHHPAGRRSHRARPAERHRHQSHRNGRPDPRLGQQRLPGSLPHRGGHRRCRRPPGGPHRPRTSPRTSLPAPGSPTGRTR